MKETFYKAGASHLKDGVCLLAKSVWHTVENHPACTALAISMIANVFMFVGLAQARIDRDCYNAEAYKAEKQRDSLQIMAPYWTKDNNHLKYKEWKQQ